MNQFNAHMMPGQGTSVDAEKQCACISSQIDQGVDQLTEHDEQGFTIGQHGYTPKNLRDTARDMRT